MSHLPRIVKVVWKDAAHDTLGWGESLEKAREFQIPIVVSIGFLVAENKQGLKICQSITDGAIAQSLVIPRMMIQSVERWESHVSSKIKR